MFHFEQNQQQNRNENDEQPDKDDWAAITQQFMLKTEQYSTDKSIPPAPLPPNISYLCYFDEHSAKLSNSGRNDWEPLTALKVEPDEELFTRRKRNVFCGAGIAKRINPSQPECTNTGDYNLPPIKFVKAEPEEQRESPTESSLSAYVEYSKNGENVPCREHLSESNNRKTLSDIRSVPGHVTATSSRGPTLGYSVYVENSRNGILASSYQSINNKLSSDYTEYWLPILSTIEDWPYIKDEFLLAVSRVCAGIHFSGSTARKVFKVCSSLMSSAIVRIMKSCRNEADSTRYINGFFSIYRLLHQYAQDDEDLIELSNRALTNFILSPAARVKKAVPNLGEFLMHLTVSTQYTWPQMSKVFMDESDARCVFWYCCGNHNSPPAHPELIDVYHYRSDRESKVFHATTVSRNLIMFQVKFASMTKSKEFTEFRTNFERVRDFLTAKLKNLYDRVVAIKNWDEFYDFLQMPRVSLAKRNSDLAQAVTRSAVQGYHKRSASDMGAGIKFKRRRMQ